MSGVFKTSLPDFSSLFKDGVVGQQAGSSYDANFGHIPPEEGSVQKDDEGDCVLVNDGEDDHQSLMDSTVLGQDSGMDDALMQTNLSSIKGEDMIVSH